MTVDRDAENHARPNDALLICVVADMAAASSPGTRLNSATLHLEPWTSCFGSRWR